jgi:hypothetical protein
MLRRYLVFAATLWVKLAAPSDSTLTRAIILVKIDLHRNCKVEFRAAHPNY